MKEPAPFNDGHVEIEFHTTYGAAIRSEFGKVFFLTTESIRELARKQTEIDILDGKK